MTPAVACGASLPDRGAANAIIYISELMVTDERRGLFAVLHASSVLESRAEARLGAVGLSLAKLAALRRLAEAGGSLPLGQLAERLSCVKSNVTQLVDRLEADGLVSRAADTADRRSRLAVLTDAGRRAHTRGLDIQDEAERELFAALSHDEAEQLHALLAKISA
jgi:DNA-binding MarR family transcriptional regulator